MPFYIYQCHGEGCGKKSTYLVPRVGDAPTECRYCHSADIKRIFDGQTVSQGKSKKVNSSKNLEGKLIGVLVTVIPKAPNN